MPCAPDLGSLGFGGLSPKCQSPPTEASLSGQGYCLGRAAMSQDQDLHGPPFPSVGVPRGAPGFAPAGPVPGLWCQEGALASRLVQLFFHRLTRDLTARVMTPTDENEVWALD